MLKQILNLDGAQELGENEQKSIKGSGAAVRLGRCYETGCNPGSQNCDFITVPCDSMCPPEYGGWKPFCFAW